jgi:hypothetical protein
MPPVHPHKATPNPPLILPSFKLRMKLQDPPLEVPPEVFNVVEIW